MYSAHDEEERTLGAYSGFGAIKEVLENPTGKPDKDGMATLVAELHEVIRANTPDEDVYKRQLVHLQATVQTQTYQDKSWLWHSLPS